MRPERITTGIPLHAEDSAHRRTEGSSSANGSVAWVQCGAEAYHPGLGRCVVIDARPESEYATVQWPDTDYPSDVKKKHLIRSPLNNHYTQQPNTKP